LKRIKFEMDWKTLFNSL